MMNLQNIKIHLDSISADVKDISQLELELIKVRAVKYASTKYSDIVGALVIYILVGITFFLSTITVALYLGYMLGKIYLGFGIISLFYLFILLLLVLFKKPLLRRPIRNSFIKNIFE